MRKLLSLTGASRDADSNGTRLKHGTHRVGEQEAFKEINYLLYCTRGTRGPSNGLSSSSPGEGGANGQPVELVEMHRSTIDSNPVSQGVAEIDECLHRRSQFLLYSELDLAKKMHHFRLRAI